MQLLLTILMVVQGDSVKDINPPPPTLPPPPGLPIDSHWFILLVLGVVIGFLAKRFRSRKALAE